MSTATSDLVSICPIASIVDGTGICALHMGRQVAIFRIGDRAFAIGNRDPASGANVLARGIVGDRGGVLKVSSPIYKHSYALESGRCLDDPELNAGCYQCRVIDGIVHLGPRREA